MKRQVSNHKEMLYAGITLGINEAGLHWEEGDGDADVG